MMKLYGAILLTLCSFTFRAALQNAQPEKKAAAASPSPLTRRYQEGEKLGYHMKAMNENWRYEIQLDGEVKRNPAGGYFEEYAWSHMVSNGSPTAFPPATADFRQIVSLDPETPSSFPNLSQVDLKLIGPITDLLTFYSDLWLANKLGALKNVGDHFYFKRGTPSSWADGNYVLLGEDSIDFDFTLTEVNQRDKTATLIIRHVPPEKSEIKIPVEWMRAAVADTPNNWVEVEKRQDGKYVAEVGKETFDVQIKISLTNGKILSAKIDNPVVALKRECTDAALTACNDAVPHHILRQIEIYQ